MTQQRDVVSIFSSRADVFDDQAFEGGAGLRYISTLEMRAIRDAIAAAPGRVLDAGAGTGRISRMLTDLGASVTAVDVVPAMIEQCGWRAPHAVRVIADVGEALPFRTGVFDALTCIRVLKYVAHWPRVLAEMRRTLREGGRLIIEVTNRRSLARWGYGSNPVHACTLPEVRTMLTRAGFTVEYVQAGVRLPFAVYRWARSNRKLRWVLRAERLAEFVLGPTAFARSVIVSCRKHARSPVRAVSS